MRLSAKAPSGPPPAHIARPKPAHKAPAGKAPPKPKSYAEAYEEEEENHDEYDYEQWAASPTKKPTAPKGKGKAKPKAKVAAKPQAMSNGSAHGYGEDDDDDDDEIPHPPSMPPPKAKAGGPKPKAGGAPITPMTPAPKQVSSIKPPMTQTWGATAEEEQQEEENEEANEEENEEAPEEEAPPAKRQKGEKGMISPTVQKGMAPGMVGKGDGKGKKPGMISPAGDAKGKGKGGKVGAALQKQLKKEQEQYAQVDGIQDGLLPVQQRVDEVIAAVCGPVPVCCIGGDTGSGKSTQVPQIIFKDACDKMQEVKIAVIQPRRVAAVSLARRVANELGEAQAGGLVGYRIGGESRPGFAIDYCSTGYFLQLLVNAPMELGRYSHVILDEVHERSAESDLLCFVVRRLASGPQKGIRIVIMSATVNMPLFSAYFARLVEAGEKPAEVFVGKKCFPVAEYFLDEMAEAFPNLRCGHEIQARIGENFPTGMNARNKWSKKPRIDARHVEKFVNITVDLIRVLACPGNTIVLFLPGIGEITTIWQEAKQLADGGAFEVLPLHSMIPHEDQQLIFAKNDPKKTRVVLATDIAESSLTMPNVTIIFDFGLHRRMDHGDKRSLASLQTKWISQAAAKQRTGRAGRTQPGMCIKLYTQAWHDQMMELHEPPETQCMPLDRLYLQAKQLCEKLGQTSKIQRSAKAALLELVQSPELSQIEAARTELADLGAIDSPEENAKITRFGQLCTQLPLDLRMCRCVWLGVLFGCAADGVVLAACLSNTDPFQFPAAHFARSEDDFSTWLRETTVTRLLFDGGLQAEPLQLRQLFLEWTTTLHEKQQPHGSWSAVQQARRKHTELFAKAYRLAKGRLEAIVSQVLDLGLRTFHACGAGTRACAQLRQLVLVLGYSINERGDLGAVTKDQLKTVKKILSGPEAIFEDNTNILRGLMAATFSDFLLLGSYSGGEADHDAHWGKGKGKQRPKEKQLDLLKAVAEKEVDVSKTSWFGTQKDSPIVGIEKYVDYVCGRSCSKPQVVLQGQNVAYVEIKPQKEKWPELRSNKWAGDPIGSMFEFNLLNHYASAMREVQRFKSSACEWSFGVHPMQHPHEIKWELMQPTFDWNGRQVRCAAVLERRNSVGFVTRTPVTDENFGLLRRVSILGVASSVHGTENNTRVYPVGVTTLSAPHIAFVLATAKYSNSQWGSRFGITPDKSISIMGNCLDLPNGLLNQEWWEKIQKMRAAIRRELSNPVVGDDEESAFERATGGVAPLVLSDAEDVQECVCALLEDAENFHGKEAVEALEETDKMVEIVQYNEKEVPVAWQPLCTWDDIEHAATRAIAPKKMFMAPKGKGKSNFQSQASNMMANMMNQFQQTGKIQPAWMQQVQQMSQQFAGENQKISPAGGKIAAGGGGGGGMNILQQAAEELRKAQEAEGKEPGEEEETQEQQADEEKQEDADMPTNGEQAEQPEGDADMGENQGEAMETEEPEGDEDEDGEAKKKPFWKLLDGGFGRK